MYELDYSKGFAGNYDQEKHFNTISITDPLEFIDKHGRDISNLFIDSSYLNHIQPVQPKMPFFSNVNLTEGTVVMLEEIDEKAYLGIIETIAYQGDERVSVDLTENEAFVSIHVFCSYEKTEDSSMGEPQAHNHVHHHRYASIDLHLEEFRVNVLEEDTDFDLDLLHVVSDEYLSEVLEEPTIRVPYEI